MRLFCLAVEAMIQSGLGAAKRSVEVPNLEVTGPQDWQVEQLLKLLERQPDLVEPALRRLVEENDDIHWSVVVGAYRDEQINLGKAAELLHMTELELRDRFIELGIPLRIGPKGLAEARAEVEAMCAWFDHAPDKGRS